jgi:hypothetical protein
LTLTGLFIIFKANLASHVGYLIMENVVCFPFRMLHIWKRSVLKKRLKDWTLANIRTAMLEENYSK